MITVRKCDKAKKILRRVFRLHKSTYIRGNEQIMSHNSLLFLFLSSIFCMRKIDDAVWAIRYKTHGCQPWNRVGLLLLIKLFKYLHRISSLLLFIFRSNAQQIEELSVNFWTCFKKCQSPIKMSQMYKNWTYPFSAKNCSFL